VDEKMMQTVWAVIHEGKIVLSEPAELPEGAKVLVTLLTEDESDFWAAASHKSLAAVWDNTEDDAYAQILRK
jgi:hypothetical protein